MAKPNIEPETGVMMASSTITTVCECCGALTIELLDDDGAVFAALRYEADGAAGLATHIFDRLNELGLLEIEAPRGAGVH